MATAFVTDNFAGPLAARLRELKAREVYLAALEMAQEETHDYLTEELQAERAPEEIIEALQIFPVTAGLIASVGIANDGSQIAEAASDFEYGSIDGRLRPHGTFRHMNEMFGEVVAIEVAGTIADAIGGVM